MDIVNLVDGLPFMPVAHIPRVGGGSVPVKSLEIGDLFAAYMLAIGEPPPLPALSHGSIEINASALNAEKSVVGYQAVYNPGEDELNKAKIETWKMAFSAWQAQCEPVRAVVNLLLEKGKQ